jgi:beta-glucosidase
MDAIKVNANSSIETFDNLIAHMTLEQKIAQLQCCLVFEKGLDKLLGNFPNGVGAISALGGASTPQGNADFMDKVQSLIMEKNDLHIPALSHAEALTGLVSIGATSFPSAIGLGATWDPEAVEKMADIIREQMLAIGVRQALSPVMDVARDPRWGRIGETYGEDPTLCAAMSVAFTRGLQGKNLKDGVIVTGKHFLGYAFSEGGLNQSSNPIPPRELREVYAKPFQAAITEAHLQSMMNSYGTIDGEMVIKSKHILSDLLRDEMGFEGLVVSDYMSVKRAVDMGASENPATAGIESLQAGLDVELPFPYGYTGALIAAVQEGKLDVATVDQALRRVLTAKFKLGLFDNPFARRETLADVYDTQKARAHSLKLAHESIILLKNEGILPLSKETKKIAVIGPHADSLRLLFGGYSHVAMLDVGLSGAYADMMVGLDIGGGEDDPFGGLLGAKVDLPPFYEGSKIRQQPAIVEDTLKMMIGHKTPTILAAIKAKCPNAEVIYERGCDIAGNNRSGFAAASAAAKSADVVILTLGGKFGTGNNSTIGEAVDSTEIGLPGIQEEFAKLIIERGTPTVLVHMDARPLSSEFIAAHYPAILENWFPGETGGEALADVLFGDYNPAGRLAATAARAVGQIPVYAMHRNGDSYRKRGDGHVNKYVEESALPLFYFGQGLSYTTFEYSNLGLDKKVKAGGTVHLSVDVKNTGTRDGEEVVQVYVRDEKASMLRPGLELAGFKRVGLKAGETRKIHFQMKADQFAFLDVDMKWIVEAGKMTVKVGSSSEDIRLSDTFEIEDTAFIVGKNRGFFARTMVD